MTGVQTCALPISLLREKGRSRDSVAARNPNTKRFRKEKSRRDALRGIRESKTTKVKKRNSKNDQFDTAIGLCGEGDGGKVVL